MNTEKTIYTFRTKTGLPIRVRYLGPDDAPCLIYIFEHMGSESRYQRFHQTVDNPSLSRVRQEAERIIEVDQASGKGLIAFADLPGEPDVPVAAARYVADGSGAGEAAISVRDDLQGMGIGTNLLCLLAEEAKRAGLHKLVGSVQNSNKAIWCLLHHLPCPLNRTPEGSSSTVELDLTSLPLAARPLEGSNGQEEKEDPFLQRDRA